jgi:Uma2 family endonuclease
MAAMQVPLYTPAEYLVRERAASFKSEYISGEIFAMAGGSPEHNMIATDVSRILGNRLEEAGGGCEVFNSDQKVRIDEADPFFYPDVSVVCGDPRFDGDGCLRNPVLVAEVLSASTAEYDRGEKFRNYRRLSSLRHYLLISLDRVRVEHYQQREGFIWAPVGDLIGLEDVVSLPDLGITVPLLEIYRRIQFE